MSFADEIRAYTRQWLLDQAAVATVHMAEEMACHIDAQRLPDDVARIAATLPESERAAYVATYRDLQALERTGPTHLDAAAEWAAVAAAMHEEINKL